MPRRSEPAPGSVIAIAPTSSPRTSARHPGPPLLVRAVVEHVVRRDLVHALAEAREARRAGAPRRHALEAEVAPEPAVLLRHVGAQQPGLPRAPPELGVDVSPRLPAPRRWAGSRARPRPARSRGTARARRSPRESGAAGGGSRSCADHRTRRRDGQMALAASAIWPTRRVHRPMPIRSPHPDVHVPDVTLTDFVLGDAAARGERPAIVDAVSGAVLTYAQLAEDVDRCAAGLAARGLAAGRGRRHLRAQRARVRRRVSRRRPRRRDEHDRQRALHGRGGRVPAAHRRCPLPRDRPGTRRAGARGGAQPPASRRSSRSATPPGRRRSRTCSRRRGLPRRGRRIDPATPRRRAAVLERHDRAPQGRHADAPQPRREPLPVRARAAHRRDRPRDRGAAVLPHLRADARAQRRAAARRDDRHDAPLRPRAVPRGDRAARASPPATSRRRSCSRSPSTRSSTSTISRACASS